MYLGKQKSMPPADVAIKLAKVLNVTVEYLVTGETADAKNSPKHRQIENDFKELPPQTKEFIKTAIHLFAAHEKKHGTPFLEQS